MTVKNGGEPPERKTCRDPLPGITEISGIYLYRVCVGDRKDAPDPCAYGKHRASASGDEVYSNRKSPFKLQGQTLHAKTLGFIHPTTGEYLEIDAPLPEYFEHLLTVLEK